MYIKSTQSVTYVADGLQFLARCPGWPHLKHRLISELSQLTFSPEVLLDGDAKSWFKMFKVCAVASEWDNDKKLKCLPTLLKGRAWTIFDTLLDTSADTYEHLKEVLLSGLSPNTEED